MKYSELKELTVPELTAKGRDLAAGNFTLRLQQAGSQLEKPARLATLPPDLPPI